MAQLSDSEKIEILIDQVGRMTESITELRMSVEDMSEGITELRIGITELRITVEHGFTELKTVSERQERNIDRLVGIVETLIQERRSN